jgi:protein SCO1/2
MKAVLRFFRVIDIGVLARVVAVALLAAAPLAQAALAQSKPPKFPMQGRDLGTPLGEEESPERRLLRQVAFDQKLDAQLPLDLFFRNEAGETVQFNRYFGERPVVLALVQYECPMLCSEILNGLLYTVDEVPFDIGKEYDVVVVSIDHRETPQQAAEEKAPYVRRYGREGADKGWHFLVGDEQSIARLADSIGYRFVFDAEKNQFAHPSGILVATPMGKVSHYFYGVQYPSKDLRLSLVEASENKIGSAVDAVLLYCYHYDPTTGRYGVVVMNIVRVIGAITVAALVLAILYMLRRERSGRLAGAAGLSEG